MDQFGSFLAIIAFSLSIGLMVELKKTKQVLSKYINEEDKEFLNKKQKAGKWSYIFIGLHIIAIPIIIYFVFIKK